MSDEAAAAVAPPAEAPAPEAPMSPADALVAKVREAKGQLPQRAADQQPPMAPATDPVHPDEPAEAPAEETPAAAGGEDVEALRSKLLRAQDAAKRTERRYRETESELKSLKEQVERLTGLEQSWKEDPYKAAEQHGVSFEEWARRAVESEPATPEMLAIQRLQKQLEEVTGSLSKERETRAEAEQRQQHEANLAQVQSFVANTAGMGLVGELGLHEGLLQTYVQQRDEAGEDLDFEQVASGYADQLAADLRRVVLSDAGIAALRSDPASLSKLSELLGAAPATGADTANESKLAEQATPSAPSEGNRPSTLTTEHAAQTGTRGQQKLTRKDRHERAKAVIAGLMRA